MGKHICKLVLTASPWQAGTHASAATAVAPYMAQVVAEGHLNAIAFWFDLHLDEQVSITSAPPGFGIGGAVTDPNPVPEAGHGRGEVSEDNPAGAPAEDTPCAAATADAVDARASAAGDAAGTAAPGAFSSGSVGMAGSQGARMAPPAAGAADLQGTATSPAAAGAADGQVARVVHATAASTPEALAIGNAAACAPHTMLVDTAEPSGRQQGPATQRAPDAPGEPATDCNAPARLGQEAMVGPAACAKAGAADPAGLAQGAKLARAPCAEAGEASGAGGAAKGHEADDGGAQKSSGTAEPHYWGQALQYLDCSTPVAPGAPHVLPFHYTICPS